MEDPVLYARDKWEELKCCANLGPSHCKNFLISHHITTEKKNNATGSSLKDGTSGDSNIAVWGTITKRTALSLPLTVLPEPIMVGQYNQREKLYWKNPELPAWQNPLMEAKGYEAFLDVSMWEKLSELSCILSHPSTSSECFLSHKLIWEKNIK